MSEPKVYRIELALTVHSWGTIESDEELTEDGIKDMLSGNWWEQITLDDENNNHPTFVELVEMEEQ